MATAFFLVAVSVGTAGAAATGHPARAALTTALPSSRLEFGLGNFDSTWMTSSGVPWRYRFQYLSGGVNTGSGWETWNSPAGQFAAYYMTNSTKPPANYIPVFTYYELLQSSPSAGSSEQQRDYNNLNNASTMNSYYSNFKLLMQKAGAYGGQVVVHVEPDFWGYMQQIAGGSGAAAVAAQVKSSNFPEAAAFADNLVGFASELKYLRDVYAPNALLAMHASMWSSGIDIASNTSAAVNASAEADKTAAFLNSAGVGGWDAVFNDVDDHNAAWWELASCGTPPCVNQYYTHWWDPNNVNFPNFSRYLTWVGELHSQTSRPQIVWQVPMGNQYFLTMNNTCGHYQDNVAPYFISHAGQLFNAGLVAVLFGAGNACQTSYDDSRNDGVTNNNGSATTDQLGGCSACNTHVSSWADDDGGYLRIFVGQYYAGLGACTSVGVSAVPGSPKPVGTPVQLTATAGGCPNPNPLYEFWVLYPGSQTWQPAQAYSSNATFSWTTTGKPAGTYNFSVWARDASSAGVYGNSLGRWDVYNASQYTLQPVACTSAGLTPPSSSVAAGTMVNFSATAGSSCPNPVFQYWLLPPGGSWTVKRPFSSNGAWSWDTTGLVLGAYRVVVWANQSGDSTSNFEAYAQSTITVTGCTSVSVSAGPGSPQPSGTPITLAASAGGCASPTYQFFVLAPGSSTWVKVRAYSSNGVYNWVTTGAAKGVYHFSVWVQDAKSGGAAGNSLGRWDAYSAPTYTLT